MQIKIGKEYSCLDYKVWVVTVHRIADGLVAYSWIDDVFKTLHANTMRLDEFERRFEVKV